MLDSSGSLFAPGLFAGSYISFGDFDSCLAVKGEHNQHQVFGKHCFFTVRLPANTTKQIDYHYSSLLPQSQADTNLSWPDTLIKRWTELNVNFAIAHSLCVPSICTASFVRQVILDGNA